MIRFHVAGVGNAIVDVLASADDHLLRRLGLPKGGMQLVTPETSERIYRAMGSGTEMSGGAAANTIVGVASLGGSGAFIGKVRDDDLGRVFRHDLNAAGVHFETPAASSGPGTARSLILITPDAQRTMNTYLGIAVELGPDDIDEAVIGAAEVTYLEGYLFDPPAAQLAFVKAADLAHRHARKVALSLSDVFCVDRHFQAFNTLVDGHVDVLFSNEAEILALTGATRFDDAVRAMRGRCDIAALTRGAHGSVILSGEQTIEIAAAPVSPAVIDTTGAGDLYAAGFLYGLTHGRDLQRCGEIASIAAAEIISHVGGRPQVKLADLVRERLG